jgi:DNA transformation protein
MSPTPEEIEFATDLFSGLGPLTSRKMMGGLCLYSDGNIFTIVHSNYGTMLKGAGAFKDMNSKRWV